MQNTNTSAVVTVGNLDNITLKQKANGLIEAISSQFSFDKLSGLAKVTQADGTISGQWQCELLTNTGSAVLGWAWPTIMQADLPAPDVNVTDTNGLVVGRAYSAPIAKFWDVPVTDSNGVVTHFAASVTLPDATYVSVSALSGAITHYYLTP